MRMSVRVCVCACVRKCVSACMCACACCLHVSYVCSSLFTPPPPRVCGPAIHHDQQLKRHPEQLHVGVEVAAADAIVVEARDDDDVPLSLKPEDVELTGECIDQAKMKKVCGCCFAGS